jgi:hypothetical protein
MKKKLVNLSRMEYGVKVWRPEGELQENDRINNMSCKEIINVHGLAACNKTK